MDASLIRFLVAEQPDIVCLQEAFRPGTKTILNFQNQYGYVERLQLATGLTNYFFAPAWGFVMNGQTIDQGVAILSKLALADEQSFHAVGEYTVYSRPGSKMYNDRSFLACTATLPSGDKLSIATYHGYWNGTDTTGNDISFSSTEKARALLATLPAPTIFCADLNVTPGSPVLEVLARSGLRNLTVEYNVPTTLSSQHYAPEPDRSHVACDYILTSPGIIIKDFRVIDEPVSDHKPLVLEFEI